MPRCPSLRNLGSRAALPRALVLLLALTASACSSDPHSLPPSEPLPDSGASHDAGAGFDLDLPGTRPTLSSPGQIVPLLYARSVRVEERQGSTPFTIRVPLDDPEHASYQEVFGHLELACRREVALAHGVNEPTWPVDAACGLPGALAAETALCRAKTALAFAVSSPNGSLWLDGSAPRVDTGSSEHAGALFAVTSRDTYDRASWAMYAVFVQREVIGRLGAMFDPDRCPRSSEDSTASWPEWAARAMADAAHALPKSTALADQLLDARLHDRYDAATEDPEARVQATRGLTDSLLERLKLHIGVPYGAFTPLGGEPVTAVDDPARYPVRYPVSEEVGPTSLMLTTLRTPLFGVDGEPLAGESLREAWFATLRAALPVVFGGLSESDVNLALSQFQITGDELDAAAAFLRQSLRVSGTPVVERAMFGGPHRVFETLRHLGEPSPLGYVAAITEARATLDATDGIAYTARSTSAALEYAGRAARKAVDAEFFPAGALDVLRDVSAEPELGLSHAKVCVTRAEPGVLVDVTIPLPRDATAESAARYELAQGEGEAACALGTLFGHPCPPVELLAGEFDRAARAAVFHVAFEPDAPTRLYLLERDAARTTTLGRGVVAAIALDPLDTQQDRCGSVPLASGTHATLAELHDADIAVEVPRAFAEPTRGLDFALLPVSPVPLLWERGLMLKLGSAVRSIDLGQPFQPSSRDLEEDLLAHCAEPELTGKGANGQLCLPEREVSRRLCLLQAYRSAVTTGKLGDYVAPSHDPEADFVLALQAQQAARDLIVEVGVALSEFDCVDSGVAADNQVPLLEQRLWDLAASESEKLVADFLVLLDTYEQRIESLFGSGPDGMRTIDATRSLRDSRLAAARLMLGIPFGLYDLGVPAQDGAEGAFRHFPTVTRPARVAEDTLAESLLRLAALDPLLPGLSFVSGNFSPRAYEDALTGNAFVNALRTRLIEADPGRFKGLPSSAPAVLSALGVSREQLGDAALRLVQSADARGLSLLPRTSTDPVQAAGLSGTYGAPNGQHLFALSEGRGAFARDAWPTHFASRGVFHALAWLGQSLAARIQAAEGWSATERAQRIAIQKAVAAYAGRPEAAITFDGVGEPPSVDLYLPAGALTDLTQDHELWWTDSGLRCALYGSLEGMPCDEADFRFEASAVSPTAQGLTSDGRQAVQLSGFAFPQPVGWNPQLSLEPKRGRIYLTRTVDGAREVIAAASLDRSASHPTQIAAPYSNVFFAHVAEVLGYREHGEGCSACQPSSVCETTQCVLGLCVRTPLSGRTCAAEGHCVAGICDQPGCGDGARSDGTDGVPFEACDDGNLDDGDGCSASCNVETRALEPIVKEGWPAGPAPALATDGLGQALLVYMADDLSGETVRVRGALFDPFGVQLGDAFDLETGLPRGFQSKPTVAGLASGGFVAVYASPALDASSGIAFRLVDQQGQPSMLEAVDDNGAAQGDPRVVSVEDGFVISWTERSGASDASRVRLRRFGADGQAVGESVSAGAAAAGVSQGKSALASSLGQVAVAWTETWSGEGGVLGVRARRFGAALAPVDGQTISVADGAHSEPSITTLGSDQYKIAWTQRTSGAGNIMTRALNRFGTPLTESSVALVNTDAAESLPTIAAGNDDSFVVAYQIGAPFSVGAITAQGIDTSSLAVAADELARTDLRDVSAVPSSRGIWLLWSRRIESRRALFALLLPPSE